MRKGKKKTTILLNKKIFLIMNPEYSIWILNSGVLVKVQKQALAIKVERSFDFSICQLS